MTTTTSFVARLERFDRVGSTNDVVREWLATGEPEVCVAVAAEQTAGRGRQGRTWTAPAGAGLLASIGFRPTWLAPDRFWRLAASVSLAMADGAEEVVGLASGSIRLKWPNDLVVERDGRVLKLGGVLGETDGLGGGDPTAIVGIGLNADWPASDFPPELSAAMTSLRALHPDGPVDSVALLMSFLDRLGERIETLRRGGFDAASWAGRQVTTGRSIDLIDHDGISRRCQALGVDPDSGALRIADDKAPAGERWVMVGEIRHVRLAAV